MCFHRQRFRSHFDSSHCQSRGDAARLSSGTCSFLSCGFPAEVLFRGFQPSPTSLPQTTFAFQNWAKVVPFFTGVKDIPRLRSGFGERLSQRQKAFKKGVDADDARRKREDAAVQLRKATRDEALMKKRMVNDLPPGQVPDCLLKNGILFPGCCFVARLPNKYGSVSKGENVPTLLLYRPPAKKVREAFW